MDDYTYYNDVDHFCCEVLRRNIARGNLSRGLVDERDIREVQAADLVEYTHVHLFAGVGGFPLGLSRARFPQHVRIITGGFPCQDVSQVNPRGKGITGERSGLWREMFRLVRDLRPDYVCVENVRQLLTRGLDTILADFSSIGYDAEWSLVSACSMGAPHVRQRMFIVAYPMREGRAPIWDGLSAWQNNSISPSGAEVRERSYWKIEPAIRRLADGLSDRLARVNRHQGVKAYGNSLVPQIAEHIGRQIVLAEHIQRAG